MTGGVTRRVAAGLVLTSSVLLVAAAPGVTGAAGASTRGARAPSCRPPTAGSSTVETISFAGTDRRYRLAVPTRAGKRPLPLIVNFHGFGSNAAEQAVYSQLEQKGPAHGFVVATPQGTGKPAFWNILPKLTVPDDIAYTGALIDHLEQVLCIDPRRVYATGISNGAGMSAYLGCRITGRLAAIAPVAGINLVAGCPHGPPLPVLAFHGNTDPTVPYGGGDPGGPLKGTVLASAPLAVAVWARHDRCSAKPVLRRVRPHIVETDYRGCANGTAVRFYTIEGGGHTWPGSLNIPRLGSVTQEINAADLILGFFTQHPAASRR